MDIDKIFDEWDIDELEIDNILICIVQNDYYQVKINGHIFQEDKEYKYKIDGRMYQIYSDNGYVFLPDNLVFDYFKIK